MTWSDDFIMGHEENSRHPYFNLYELSFLCKQSLFFQELRLDGNRLKRVPTASLGGPASLQNLHLQDNIIGECDHE